MSVVTHEVLHHFEEIREGLDAIDEILGRDAAAAHYVERLTNQRRGVMEACLARQLGVMQKAGIELDTCVSLGQPPKKFTTPPRRSS